MFPPIVVKRGWCRNDEGSHFADSSPSTAHSLLPDRRDGGWASHPVRCKAPFVKARTVCCSSSSLAAVAAGASVVVPAKVAARADDAGLAVGRVDGRYHDDWHHCGHVGWRCCDVCHHGALVHGLRRRDLAGLPPWQKE